MIDTLLYLVNVVAWILIAWRDSVRYRAGSISLGWPLVDVTLLLAFAVIGWRSYIRHRTELRERAFRALAAEPSPSLQEPRSVVMHLGSRGPAVVRWKDRLRSLGYQLSNDDLFDEGTALATAKYQEWLGVVADGMAGPRTLKAAVAMLSDTPLAVLRRWRSWRRR